MALVSCLVSADVVANTIWKFINVLLVKHKNVIVYYDNYAVRKVRTNEAIDVLHFKIACGKKKLLTFNRCLLQCLIGKHVIKYKHKWENNISFSSV